MRILIILAPLALLAACGGTKATNNNSGGNPASTNTAATTPAAPAPATPAPAAPGADPRRAEMLAECTTEATTKLGAAEGGALCACAVDKVIGSGLGQNAATQACAAELGITVPKG